MTSRIIRSRSLNGKLVTLETRTKKHHPHLKKILNHEQTMKSLLRYFGTAIWTDEMIAARYNNFEKGERNGEGLGWIVRLNASNEIVGEVGFKNIVPHEKKGEFGIILHQSVWGTGVA